MKFKVPEGLTELTHGGVKYIAKDGFIDAPDAARPELKAHGCEPVKHTASDTAAVKQEKRA